MIFKILNNLGGVIMASIFGGAIGSLAYYYSGIIQGLLFGGLCFAVVLFAYNSGNKSPSIDRSGNVEPR